MTNDGINPWKILGWLADLMAGIAIAYSIYIGSQLTVLSDKIQDIQVWRAETTGNRWNSQMQADYAAKQTVELTRLWAEIATMKTEWVKSLNEVNIKLASLPATLQLPPKWWEGYVRENLSAHKQRLDILEQLQNERLKKEN